MFIGFIGAAGFAILAVTSIAGLAVIGFIAVVYAAHCFLTVVIDSGCGVDEVRWPSEGVFDWLLKPVYCLWLVAAWGVILGAVLLPLLIREPQTFAITLAAALFVLYPITLLSSLSGKSWIALLYRPFLRRWARWPGAFVAVLVLGTPLALGMALVVGLTLTHSLWWLFLAALVCPLLFLWYARLIGRYAWLVTHTPLKKKARSKAPPPVHGVSAADPWAAPTTTAAVESAPGAAGEPEVRIKLMDGAPGKLMPDEPEEEEDEWTPVKKPYGVMDEAQAKQSWHERKTEPLGDEPGYDMDAAVPLAAPFSLTGFYENYVKEEEKRRERTDPPRPKKPTFALAFGAGLFRFPFYGATLKPWINLGLLTFFALFFARMLFIAASVVLS